MEDDLDIFGDEGSDDMFGAESEEEATFDAPPDYIHTD